MSIGRTLIGILVLATSICVFAQTTETKPPQRPQPNFSATSAPNPCHSGAKALEQVEILTDTMGVNFGPYMTRIVQIVKQNWYNNMPPSVYPPIFKQGKLKLEFQILKDGTVTGLVRDTSSGDEALDYAAWSSITASDPFPQLPKEFPGKLLGLRFYYFYNLNPGADIGVSSISVSPCGDVQVPAGSTLQFSASGKGITDTSVTWSVSGPGCSKSACGTVSDTGLYTAPADIPNPPTIIVEATPRTDVTITAKSKVTIVQANPSH
jgi:TonB family protein